MDYSTILTRFRSCMEEIGNALRTVLGTSKKYKFTEIASAIRSCNQVYDLGVGTSFNVSHIPGFSALTVNNFLVCTTPCSGRADEAHSCSATASHTWNYNPSTGILTISGGSASAVGQGSVTSNYLSLSLSAPRVYLVKGPIK